MILGRFLFFSPSCMAALQYCTVQQYGVTVTTKVVIASSQTEQSVWQRLHRNRQTGHCVLWSARETLRISSGLINQVVTMLIHSSGKKFLDIPKIFNNNYGYSRFAREFIRSASVANIVNKTKEENRIPFVVELWKCCSEHCGNVVGKLSKSFFSTTVQHDNLSLSLSHVSSTSGRNLF